jgi:hypothetical protein
MNEVVNADEVALTGGCTLSHHLAGKKVWVEKQVLRVATLAQDDNSKEG